MSQSLPIGETYEKAKEIVEILQMWEINQSDALSISRHMTAIIDKMKAEDWASHQLKGTGLVIPGHKGYRDGTEH